MTQASAIRPVADGDAAAIAAIYAPYVEQTVISFETTAPDAEEMLRRIHSIRDCGMPYIVAIDDTGVAGYAYVHPWKERHAYRHTVEATVYLRQDARRCGIGLALMRELIGLCRADGRIHAVIACITADNLASQALCRRFGFEKVSHFRQVGYKSGRWLDVVDYQLTL